MDRWNTNSLKSYKQTTVTITHKHHDLNHWGKIWCNHRRHRKTACALNHSADVCSAPFSPDFIFSSNNTHLNWEFIYNLWDRPLDSLNQCRCAPKSQKVLAEEDVVITNGNNSWNCGNKTQSVRNQTFPFNNNIYAMVVDPWLQLEAVATVKDAQDASTLTAVWTHNRTLVSTKQATRSASKWTLVHFLAGENTFDHGPDQSGLFLS